MFNLFCQDSEPSILGFFDPSIAPNLLYYSYIPIALASLVFGFLVIRNRSGFQLPNLLFFLLTLVFSLYIIDEILLWILSPASSVHFGWVLVALFFTLLTICLVYFFYVFINKKDTSFTFKLFLFVFSLPVILLLPTHKNMTLFNLVNCESYLGSLFIYIYALMGISVTGIITYGLYAYRKSKRTKVIILTIGSALMLLILLFSDALGELTRDFEVNLIGPIGMLVFLGVLAFLIVKYKAFNIKLIGAQVLMVALWFLVGSLIFVAVSDITRVVAGITLVFTTIAGYFLVRSVKREVALRVQVEDLVVDLAKANDRLKELDKMKSEFVSIASHQLRSPLTSIRGYASMLVEGSYGKLPAKAQEAVQNIADSSMYMVRSVEDYLSVSRIEAGNMKYEMSDFSLKETAERLVDELRVVAIKKGLVLVFRSDCSGNGMIHADIGKTRQVLQNLIDNSMKYTPKGTITVVAHDDVRKKKMCVTIHDTGVGMSPETLEEVFEKFVRAKNANSINVTGTGLGLFVAKKMVDSMGGKVWAESEGEGKGSIFHVEFPLVAGK